MNILEIFNNLRYHHENEVVEFKKAENNFDFDDLGKYFSALSNEANLRAKSFAWLVFGVLDKTREIFGTSYKNNMKSLQKLKQDLSQHTTDNNRNKFLAQAMANIKMIDTEGFGIHKMFVSQKDRYLPMPDYDKSDSNTVVLTLPGNVIDENYSLLLLENSDIDLTTAVLLDKVQKGKPINDNAIAMLRKKGLIEGRKPHLYVSRQVAKVTNKQVEYTLKKGFNDQECQEWIIKALKDHKALSRKQINELLWSKLPVDYTDEQKMSKIKNLLYKMHKQGIIYLGEDKKWHLTKS